MSNFEIISFRGIDENNHFLQLQTGLRIQDRNSRPHIHLFLLPGGDVPFMGQDLLKYNLPYCCESIIEKKLPTVKMQDVSWTYSKGAFHNDFVFNTHHQQIKSISFSNSMALHYGVAFDVERYQKCLNDARGFEKATLNGESESRYIGAPEERLVIPVPYHPAQYVMMKQESDNHRIVYANPEQFIKFWFQQTLRQQKVQNLTQLKAKYLENAKRMNGDSNPIAPFHTTFEDSVSYIRPAGGYPYPDFPAQVSYLPPQNASSDTRNSLKNYFKLFVQNKNPTLPQSNLEEIGFTNGRHRILNLYNCGAPFLPFSMYICDNTNAFEEKYGWQGEISTKRSLEQTLDL